MTLEEFLIEWNKSCPQLLVHTSGSTGKPKPIWVSKQKMLNSARITCNFLGLQPGDSALLCMNLDYIAGKMMVVRSIERNLKLLEVSPSGHPLRTLLEGGGTLWETPAPSRAMSTATGEESCIPERGNFPFTRRNQLLPSALHKVAYPPSWKKSLPAPIFAAMVPLQVYNSLQIPQEASLLRRVKHLIIGGGSIDEALEQQLIHFPNAVWSTYGMTETLSHIALRRLNGPEASEWYTPFESVEVSRNADGCLVVDAPLVHEGPLVTHDRVEFRPMPSDRRNGRVQFKILGRQDNVINSGGIKIQMEEVEKTLKSVLHSPYLITKRPDEKFGEVVVLLTEASDLSLVKVCCEKILPRYWEPRLYLHVDHIPLTGTGKPARAEAEKIALREKDR
ncbi:MAG: O-succinylbenzoic acid--CoA ligase [Prevotella sp.]|nr:O-succinylbenzoic acid--CoA ligase [Prevotella sp.]MCH3986160.1 O-succinylbenzoic acid--CoA ligase [Prevotella sp.]MCH3992950.1 O-succinylbenzoic acid--CoA ligase [Prevotella sp.]MCH4018120.1 O-succinylbenzoic acid--CoA ligase [Prevotella sp.]MCH4186787.1 O-succinylbenzoic acid--CoA ligase [Prevotella sp.]MCH4215328.1 O-succinylbenzoic acid--CoA ligase [Prevotella sp.]